MKKLALTIAIVLGMGIGAYAQGGLFKYGDSNDQQSKGLTRDGFPSLPGHGETGNQPGSPLGSGALLLIGFGAAYAAAKRRKE